MNAIATIETPTSRRIQPFAPSLPDRLNALIGSGESPVVGPQTAKALRVLADAPDAPEAPLAKIEAMLGQLAIAKGRKWQSEAEAKVGIDIYVKALAGVAMVDLVTAYDRLLKTSRFFPDVSEILGIANAERSMRNWRRSRARHLIRKHELEWTPPVADPAPPGDVAKLLSDTSKAAHADSP